MRRRSTLYLKMHWKSTTLNRYEMTTEHKLDNIHQTAIQVKDIANAVSWYTKRFACEIEYQGGSWEMLKLQSEDDTT